MEPTPQLPPGPPPPPPPPSDSDSTPPRRLTRSSSDRMVSGVCGGIGRYFEIDPTLVRIGFVALALLGGTGVIVYAAALLLVPLDDAIASPPSTPRERTMATALLIAFIVVGLVVGGFGFGFAFGGALVPLGFIVLGALAVWWLASGERPAGSPATVMRRAAQGIALLVGCVALAIASFFASGLGGGVVVAGIVVAAGAGLVAAAFLGGARWLVLPALAIALPLAFVSAAGIDLDGGFGERQERPGTLDEVKPVYRLGAGELIIDLRDVALPAGDHLLSVRIGAGHAQVIVDEDVCVASRAQVGMGAVAIFDHDSGGIDVAWRDTRRAPASTPRLVLDGNVGLGLLEVSRTRDTIHHGPDRRDDRSVERNSACTTS